LGAERGWARRRQRLTRHILTRCACTPTPGPSPVEGEGRRIPRTLDLELHQRGTDRQLLAGFAMGGGDAAGDGRGQLDRGLVGHDVGDDLVLCDHVPDLDVPGDQFSLGGAFAHVGQFEDVATHLSVLRS
jgi:hypothetical protein